jgi:nucleoside-diphosphate-sugar epimerase
MNTVPESLLKKRVLVTGATGFIGGRLIECLARAGVRDIRALVRGYTNAARIARFPIDMRAGDVVSAADVQQAAAGCDVIFHCAYGTAKDPEDQRQVNVDGTRNVLDAALASKVGRVVHLSTMMVYGATPDGDLDETAPRRPIGFPYADQKLEAEEMALRYAREKGAPVTILQPTVVYGPGAPAWTVSVIRQLKNERTLLLNHGEGLCNPVYVDDLVQAMLLAAVKPEAVGQVFLISGSQAVTWRDYYQRYAAMTGAGEFVDMSVAEAQEAIRKQDRKRGLIPEAWSVLRTEQSVRSRLMQTREGAWAKQIARAVIPRDLRQTLKRRFKAAKGAGAAAPASNGKVLRLYPLWALPVFSAKTRVSIDKARKVLGYQPATDLDQGMRQTEAWARWANLI